jgi:RNA polymerase sigma-70 factor (ECF subfamily)
MGNFTLTLVPFIAAGQPKREISIAPMIEDDAAYFERFLAGDDTAFAELFDRHNHRLFVYCLKFLGSTEMAEDVTQELWERVVRLRREPQQVLNPIGFFLRIARNLCVNAQKRSRRFSPLAELPESSHPRGRMAGDERSELEEAVGVGLTMLPFEYREVLILNVYCGYRLDEIATMLGKSSGTIWMRASRARAKLRRIVLSMVGDERGRRAIKEGR